MSKIGFLVWNPTAGLPTVTHDTLDRALAEAERLTKANPGQRFYLMAPVITPADATRAMVWEAGRASGLAERRDEVRLAERHADQAGEQLAQVNRRLRRFEAFGKRVEQFQSLVADCQCWLDGLLTAFRLRDDVAAPWTPDVARLRDLNQALRDLRADEKFADLDDEIPF